MWNWQKIDGIKNLPAFKRPVLLYQEKEDKHYAKIGYLLSIDENGANWGYNGMNDFIFFGLPQAAKKEYDPTHWCEIEIPKENKPEPEKTVEEKCRCFKLDANQIQRLENWQKEIKEKYKKFGNYTYSFTPTGIGDAVRVKSDLTDEVLDLSDVEKW